MLHLTPGLTAYILSITFVLGLCVGSFLHCLSWRLVRHESVWRGRSHCAACGRTLSALELIPVASYLRLRGRCRYCGEKIPKTCPIAELVCGLVFLSLVWRYGLGWEGARLLLFACVLLTAALTDLDAMEIPDRLHAASIFIWLALLPLDSQPHAAFFSGLLGACLVCVPLLGVVLLADKALGRETMGGGDLKLLFTTGLYFGWAGNLLLLITACLVGLVFALVARAGGRAFPFAPAIAIAAWLVMLAGQPVLDWYFGLF